MILEIKTENKKCKLDTKEITDLTTLNAIEKEFKIDLLRELKKEYKKSAKTLNLTSFFMSIPFFLLFLLGNLPFKALAISILILTIFIPMDIKEEDEKEIERLSDLKINCIEILNLKKEFS